MGSKRKVVVAGTIQRIRLQLSNKLSLISFLFLLALYSDLCKQDVYPHPCNVTPSPPLQASSGLTSLGSLRPGRPLFPPPSPKQGAFHSNQAQTPTVRCTPESSPPVLSSLTSPSSQSSPSSSALTSNTESAARFITTDDCQRRETRDQNLKKGLSC